MRFDLVDLQLFVAVAETRSITNGAQRVHLALASASERIASATSSLTTWYASIFVCSTRLWPPRLARLSRLSGMQ